MFLQTYIYGEIQFQVPRILPRTSFRSDLNAKKNPSQLKLSIVEITVMV